MVQISSKLVEIDRVCDYIPIVSTISNLVNLFEKAVAVSPFESEEQKGHYWCHIEHKQISRCFFLLIPLVSNIYYFVKELKAYLKEVREFKEMRQTVENQIRESTIKLLKDYRDQTVPADRLNPSPNKKERLFYAYCLRGDVAKAKKLLKEGVNHTFHHMGSTPLVAACMSKSKDLVQLLLDQGAQADLRNRVEDSPLEIACRSGSIEIVKLLLPRVHDKHELNSQGQSILFFAVLSNNLELIKFLLDSGLNPAIRDKNGIDAITQAICQKAPLEIIKTLFDAYSTKPYSINLKLIKSLLGSVDQTHFKEANLLMIASYVNHVEALPFLIKHFDLNAKDSEGNTALMYGAGHPAIVEALLNENTDLEMVDAVNHQNKSALFIAAEKKAKASVDLLVNKGKSQSLSKDQINKLLYAFTLDNSSIQNFMESLNDMIQSSARGSFLSESNNPRSGIEVLFGPVYEEDFISIKDLPSFLSLPTAS